jgi:NACalpha-BTF3-like transcription factor
MADLAASQRASKEAELLREKDLAAVKISKEDIDVIAAEFEIDKKLAERKLREAGGNLQSALSSLL